MFERLDQIEARYEELNQSLASPEIVNDSAKYQKTAKAHSEIAPVVEKYREYKDLTRGIAESKALLADEKDPDMRAYAQEELIGLEARAAQAEEDLKVLLGVASTVPAQSAQVKGGNSGTEGALAGDRATLSGTGTEASLGAPDVGVRADKVAEVRAALAAGTYQVPTTAVASKVK